MDWPKQRQRFSESDIKALQFNSQVPPSFSIETQRIWKNNSGKLELEALKHESERSFSEWLDKVRLSLERERIVLVLHPRLIGQHPELNVELGTMSLQCGKDTFVKMTEQMFQHRSLISLIKATSTAVFESRAMVWEEKTSWGRCFVYQCRSDTESPAGTDDVALSVTCFPKISLTFAVMYGCTETTARFTKMYLKLIQDHGQISHPMILPVLFVELERKRLLKVLERHRTRLGERILEMESTLRKPQRAQERDRDGGIEMNARGCDLTKVWMNASSLRNGLESLKFQLLDMIEHSSMLPKTTPSLPTDFPKHCAQQGDIGSEIEARLKRVVAELDSKIRCTETVLTCMSLATQMEWNYYTRRDTRANIIIAHATRKDSSQMKSISLLGMIFLPGTFLATMFSMGFFDWTSSSEPQIISPWIALYIVPTVLLTSMAIWQWRKWTVTEEENAEKQVNKELEEGDSMV